jgi:DNA repair photolyase
MVTKLKIVVRDVDLLRRIPSIVTLTVTTDDAVSKVIEPNTSSSSERLKTAEILIGKGIRIVFGLLLMNKNGLKMLQTIRLAQLP